MVMDFTGGDDAPEPETDDEHDEPPPDDSALVAPDLVDGV
jgi:hypothetical protein